MGQRARRWLWFTLVVALLPATACRRAIAIPDGEGGFTLLTTADSIEQALVRFGRSGQRECLGRPFRLGPPEILHGQETAAQSGRITVQTTLQCGTSP